MIAASAVVPTLLYIASAPRSSAGGTFGMNAWVFVFMSACTIVAIVAGAELFVIRPIEMLKRVMHRVADGDLGVRAEIPRGAPGLTDLAGAVNVMAHALEAREAARHTAEQQLRAVEQQLRQSQKMEAIGQLAGGVAHDFNNLLTAILGYSALALEAVGPGHPASDDLEEIRTAGESAAALTKQLLAFSRKQVVQPKVLNLNDVVTRSEALLTRLIGEDITLIHRLDPGLHTISADPSQIEQIIMNLAVNARDAMPAGGQLMLETRNVDPPQVQRAGAPPARLVMLAVTDTGVGMSEAVRSRVFEPFFTTKEAGKGTGLGLATVYGIVNQSGGSITVNSEVGRGTTIAAYFPCVEAAAEPAPAGRALAAPEAGSETVMLVEDEAPVRAIVGKALAANGYVVVEASEGEEAVQRALNHRGHIHLLLTDLVLPTLSGPEVAARIKTLHPEVRVLYMSGYPNETAARNGMRTPADAFLQKPFTPGVLFRRIRDVLDAPARAAV